MCNGTADRADSGGFISTVLGDAARIRQHQVKAGIVFAEDVCTFFSCLWHGLIREQNGEADGNAFIFPVQSAHCPHEIFQRRQLVHDK